MNVLQLCRWQFCTQTNFVAEFLQAKCDFRRKTAILRFWAPLWDNWAAGDFRDVPDIRFRFQLAGYWLFSTIRFRIRPKCWTAPDMYLRASINRMWLAPGY